MPGQSQWSFWRALQNGQPVAGALLYVFEAETSTPKTPYAEYSLATPLTNPLVADGNGVFPSFWLDDATSTFYRVRATDPTGVSLIDMTTCQIFGVSAGGGDPPEPVDATAIARTGDLKLRFDTSQITGWRICNGTTLGSATSGANYANSGAQALYEHLWQRDGTLAVSGGRGASSLADWSANKRLTLPDYAGYVLGGLDNMGATAARGRLAGLTSFGARIGSATRSLVAGNIPLLTLDMNPVAAHAHLYDKTTGFVGVNSGGTLIPGGSTTSTATSQSGAHTPSGTAGTPSPAAFSILPPLAGFTIYIKL